jgi:hypothetical protein
MAVEHQEISNQNLRLPMVVTQPTFELAKVLQPSQTKLTEVHYLSNHAPPRVLIQVSQRPGLASQTEIVRQHGI